MEKQQIKKHKARMLILDIETTPLLGWAWEMHETNIIKDVKLPYILCVGYKWLGEKTHVIGLPDFEGYKPDGDDSKLTKFIWELLNEADVVIGQNSDAFDLKKINTRILIHRLLRPSPYSTIDLLKVSRSQFAHPSNSLDNVASDLDEGEKIKTRGFSLWEGCMNGNMKDWKTMKRYCGRDVGLTNNVYHRYLSWIPNHPNLNMFSDDDDRLCPRCASNSLTKNGYRISHTHLYQKYQCTECGGYCQKTTGVRGSDIKAI